MNSLKLFIYIALTLLLAVLGRSESQAQFPGGGAPPAGIGAPPSAPDPEADAKREIKWMKKKLKLTPDQLSRAITVSMNYAMEQTMLLEDMSKAGFPPSQSVMQQMNINMTKLTAKKDAEMKGILTEEQFAKYLKKRRDGKENLSGPPPGFSGGRPSF